MRGSTSALTFQLCRRSSNGASVQVGKVLSYDRESSRYLLQMTDADQLRIKPQNLTL